MAAMHENNPGAKDAVQTLMSVNNIDQSVFVSEDQVTVRKYMGDYFQNLASAQVFEAIAAASGTSVVHKDDIGWTDMQWDFMLDKKKLSDTELQLRFQKADKSFWFKDTHDGQPEAPAPAAGEQALTPLEEFEKRYQALRRLIQDLAIPRLKEVFRVRAASFNKYYPHCKTLDDFLLEYKTGSYDNKKREMVDILCNKLWGKECFGSMEKMIMDKLKLRYINELVSGEEVKTHRSFGNIKKHIGRYRQTWYSERLRLVGRDIFKEVIYQRILKKPMEGVVEVVKVTKADQGYDGFMGLCVGHQALIGKAKNAPTESGCNGSPMDMFQWLQARVKEGSKMTASDILERWTKENPGIVSVVTLSGDDSSTAVSSITNSHSPAPGTKDRSPATAATSEAITTPAAGKKPAPKPAAAKKTPAKKSTEPAKKSTAPKKTATAPAAARNPTATQMIDQPAPQKTTAPKIVQKRAAPGTVATPKKANAVAPEESPKRMANGQIALPCEHDNFFGEPIGLSHPFGLYERMHFNAKLCAQVNYPKVCSGCQKSLLKGKNLDQHALIDGVYQMHCCRNAIQHRDHPCVYVLCYMCWGEKAGNSSPVAKQNRQKRQCRAVKLTFP